MADNSAVRSYRADEASNNEIAPSRDRNRAAMHDPLAELARLIGQTDPFAEPDRAEGRDPSHFAVGASPSAPGRHRAPGYDSPVQRDYDEGYQDHRNDPRFAPPSAPQNDAGPGSSEDHLTADLYGGPQDQLSARDQIYDQDQNYRQDQFESVPAEAVPLAADGSEHDLYYDDTIPLGPHDEEMYDDAPLKRRRSSLFTVVTLIGCAILGTAGAYAYRMYTVRTGPAKPPVIVADKTPVKVVPPSDTQSSGKAIQDRLGDQSTNERVVSHEEQPIQLPPAGAQAAPRVVLPAPVAPMPNASAAFPPAPAATPAPATQAETPPPATAPAATPSPNGSRPKSIRTVTIRPDGTDSPSRPAAAASASSPATRAASPSRSGSLSTSSTGTGGYVVQISSQRSEAEAHASFRAMQAKYRSVLGNHQEIIRRADLGAKGTYYRAMVGPFASAGEAGHLCSALKAAGGQCIIVRN